VSCKTEFLALEAHLLQSENLSPRDISNQLGVSYAMVHWLLTLPVRKGKVDCVLLVSA
jgi:hypothetical protein